MLPSYMGIMISHDQDPSKPISMMESRKGLERCSDVVAPKR